MFNSKLGLLVIERLTRVRPYTILFWVPSYKTHRPTVSRIPKLDLLGSISVVHVSYFSRQRMCCGYTCKSNDYWWAKHNSGNRRKPFYTAKKLSRTRFTPTVGVWGNLPKTNESFMYAVPVRSATTLLPINQRAIRQGTTVVSNLWRAYGDVAAMGFNNLTVNARTLNPSKYLRNWLKKRHNWTHRAMLNSYLCEWK